MDSAIRTPGHVSVIEGRPKFANGLGSGAARITQGHRQCCRVIEAQTTSCSPSVNQVVVFHYRWGHFVLLNS